MKSTKLTDFKQDKRNANKGTNRGLGALEKSVQELGAGRSILVDKNNVAIAGNKTLQTAINSGLKDAVVVETDGTKLVVVKRTDLDLSTDEKAKRLAIADNRINQLSLDWDAGILKEISEEVSLDGLFTEDELAALFDEEKAPPDEDIGNPDNIDRYEVFTGKKARIETHDS